MPAGHEAGTAMALSDWWNRLWHRRRGCREVPVVVWTRADCPLCDDAITLLQAAARRWRLRVELRDLNADPVARRNHEHWIPVVEIDGRVRFRGRVNPVLLERLLAATATLETPESFPSQGRAEA
jgi:hypothetical protein